MYIILDKINESIEENNEINYLTLIPVVKNEYVLKNQMMWNKVKLYTLGASRHFVLKSSTYTYTYHEIYSLVIVEKDVQINNLCFNNK